MRWIKRKGEKEEEKDGVKERDKQRKRDRETKRIYRKIDTY